MTLLITVWRKSFSPATLGEKREMFNCLWRMASSNASLQHVHNGQNTTERTRWRKEKRKAEEEWGASESNGCERRGGMRERERGGRRGRKEGRHQSVIRIPWQTQSRLLAVNSEAGWATTGTNKKNHRLGIGAQSAFISANAAWNGSVCGGQQHHEQGILLTKLHVLWYASLNLHLLNVCNVLCGVKTATKLGPLDGFLQCASGVFPNLHKAKKKNKKKHRKLKWSNRQHNSREWKY